MSASDDVAMDAASTPPPVFHATLGGEKRHQQKCRVELLSEALQCHRSICSLSHDTFSGYFAEEDMAKVAGKCWQQVQPQIKEAISDKHGKFFSELQVVEKLNRLDQLQVEHTLSNPAWRPSGIPREDHTEMEAVEAVAVIPELEKKMEEAHRQSEELMKLLSDRRKELQDLEDQIKTRLLTLNDQLT